MPGATVVFNPRAEKISSDFIRWINLQKQFDDHFLFRSSGTSGQAKWVAISKAALIASANSVNAWLEATPTDVFALALPRFHVGGYGMELRARLLGAELFDFAERSPKWEAGLFHAWLTENGGSVLSLVPTQVYDLVRSQLRSPAKLRAVVVGGGSLSQGLYREARALGWPLLTSYGLTECGSQVATAQLSSLGRADFPAAYLLSHVHAEQVGPDRVEIRSAALFSAYILQDGDVWKILDPKRGDVFELPDRTEITREDFGDQMTRVNVHGRRDEDYKILGEWIDWPKLKKDFGERVYNAGLFGKIELVVLPDSRRGLCLTVVGGELNDATKKLINEFNQCAVPFERITHVAISELPRSELGKILVAKIKPVCLQEYSG